MTTAHLSGMEFRSGPESTVGIRGTTFVDASEFRALIVSHRRMVRERQEESQVRGLRDLDTGELFLTDERRLFDGRR